MTCKLRHVYRCSRRDECASVEEERRFVSHLGWCPGIDGVAPQSFSIERVAVSHLVQSFFLLTLLDCELKSVDSWLSLADHSNDAEQPSHSNDARALRLRVRLLGAGVRADGNGQPQQWAGRELQHAHDRQPAAPASRPRCVFKR